jgi:hypothetical protein
MTVRQPLSSRSVVTVRPFPSVCVEELAELREPPPLCEDTETEELALALPEERALARDDALPGLPRAALPAGSSFITRPSCK